MQNSGLTFAQSKPKVVATAMINGYSRSEAEGSGAITKALAHDRVVCRNDEDLAALLYAEYVYIYKISEKYVLV